MHHLLLCFHSVVLSTELITLLAIISRMYSSQGQGCTITAAILILTYNLGNTESKSYRLTVLIAKYTVCDETEI